MGPALFDSSVYIRELRKGNDSVLARTEVEPDEPVWLSAVVLEELYAGAKPRDTHVLERFQRDYEKAGRILVPNLADWAEAGKVLAQVGAEYGYERIGRARLTDDALIAMSAARLGITVITANERDFALLARIRPFQWSLE